MTLCSMVLKDLKGLTALGVIDEIDGCARAAVGIQPSIVAALMDGGAPFTSSYADDGVPLAKRSPA